MAGKKAKASAQKAKGKAKVAVGELTGSKKLKAKGNADKAKAGAKKTRRRSRTPSAEAELLQVLRCEAVAFVEAGEVHERPRVRHAFAHERLVPVVAVLQEEATVLPLREQRRRLPAVVDALLHRADVVVPLLRVDVAERFVFGTGERSRSTTGSCTGPNHQWGSRAERGGEHRVVAAAAGEELADPARDLLVALVGGRGSSGETEARRVVHCSCRARGREAANPAKLQASAAAAAMNTGDA